MTIKRNTVPHEGNTSIDKTETISSDVTDFSIVDSNEQSNEQSGQTNQQLLDAINKVVLDQENAKRQASNDATMTAVPIDEYTKSHAGVTVTPSTDKKAYTGQMTPRQREELMDRLKTRTATAEDMRNIDETMIEDLPYIKASDFSIPGQYDPRPKDPSVRFRWVNCVNALQSNMQRYLALGFVTASPDDVDQEKTPLAETMIQGAQIRQYDVVLMKINVLKLMALYKRNNEVSAYKLDMARTGRTGQAAAEAEFN